MKKKMILFAAIGLLGLAACNALETPAGTEDGASLSITILNDEALATRASDATELAYEKKINNVQLFLFEGETLFSYERIDTRNMTFPYSKTWSSVKAGAYKVYAVANAADLQHIATESELLSAAVSLSDCGLTEEKGFVMAGSAQAAVGSGTTTDVSVKLHRFAARIRLVSLENDVPSTYAGGGTVNVKGVFLINALGRWNVGGVGSPAEWVNLGGRTAGRQNSSDCSDFIVSPAQVNPEAYRDQVYRPMTVSVARGVQWTFSDCCLYTFPNLSASDRTGTDVTSAAGAMTRLVVLAEVNGSDWWYPVTLFQDGKGPERNTTYDVRLVLRATGSADPNQPVEHGSLQASLSVDAWSGGTQYTEVI